jgi:RNA polymerase sigma factor (sigma-70 family)
VTHWLHQFKAGDAAAAQQLWERYFQRLVGLARARLDRHARRLNDEEDVALSAFASFSRGLEAGRFPRLDDRDNLWRLLVVITARKAIDYVQFEQRQKRDGRGVLDEAALAGPESGGQSAGIDQLISQEPTPAFAAQAAEETSRLLDVLGNPELRTIAVWKMEGYTSEEIAAKLGCVVRTVERKLWVIRNLWAKELPP